MCHFIPQSSLSQNLVEEMKQTSHNACAILSSSTTTENDQKSKFSLTSMVVCVGVLVMMMDTIITHHHHPGVLSTTSKVYKHTLAYLISMLVKNLI